MALYSIMIVDDCDEDRMLLRRQIKDAKLTDKIYEACDGVSALELLAEYEKKSEKEPQDFPPILVFLDVNMPRMNGIEFLEKFSEMKENTNNYNSSFFTVFTSFENDQDKNKALSYSFVNGYFDKNPKSPEELKMIVEKNFLDNNPE